MPRKSKGKAKLDAFVSKHWLTVVVILCFLLAYSGGIRTLGSALMSISS